MKVPGRSVEQNRLMWDMLTAWAEQDERYTLDGHRLDPYDMKEVLMAAFQRDQNRLTPDLENKGVVYLSRSTSRLSKEQMARFLTFIEAEGAMRGIVFKHIPPVVRLMPNGVPEPARNEDELRAALKASAGL